MTRRPPTSTLFPYTTLFRSSPREDDRARNNAPQSWVARASRVLVLASRQNELSRCRHAAPEKARFLQSRQQIHSRSEEHTSELQSRRELVCRLLLEKKTTPNISLTTRANLISEQRPSLLVSTVISPSCSASASIWASSLFFASFNTQCARPAAVRRR